MTDKPSLPRRIANAVVGFLLLVLLAIVAAAPVTR
jgi:uncharacterized protein involved in exopolysaccharide biosynthesis